MLVPKAEELVATPYRFKGGKAEAYLFFENGMFQAFKQINQYARSDIPVTVYYAYKQSENGLNNNTTSTGWETMLFAIVQAGFSITGTWPIRTELSNRMIGMNTNALASSIVLVCRKRPADAPLCTRRDFINALKRELKPALQKLQASNIAPVDMAQSAIGPGMGVFSRFSKVLEADGTPMSVRSALQIINQELDLYFPEQDSDGFDGILGSDFFQETKSAIDFKGSTVKADQYMTRTGKKARAWTLKNSVLTTTFFIDFLKQRFVGQN